MKTNNSVILFFILLIALTALVNGQSASITKSSETTSTTGAVAPTATVSESPVQKCLRGCSSGDVDCRAKCVGVPNPSASQVDATNQCLAKCNQTAPRDVYEACRDACLQIYFPTSTAISPTGSTPANTVNTAGSSITGSNSNPTSTESPKPVSAAISLLQYRQESLYPLMLLVISIFAGVFGFSCEIV